MGFKHLPVLGQRLLALVFAVAMAACGGGGGGGTSPAPTVTAPTITADPQNLSVVFGQSASFTVGASGTAPLSFQWRKGGATLPGATNTVLTLPSVQLTDAGGYDVLVSNSAGSVLSRTAVLTVTGGGPAITTQPAGLTVLAGGNATFSVVASGPGPLSYQWRKNGSTLVGANSTSYTVTNVQLSDAGSFDVVVTNAQGSVTSNAAALIVQAPPAILSHPTSLTVAPGQTAEFRVVASGTPTLTYQWRKNGSAIAGATASAYSLGNVQASDQGQYEVVVQNPFGSTTSASAQLVVNQAPVISTHPGSLSLAPGQSATFNVQASGTQPLAYQWRKNGTAIGGATGTTYSIPSVQASDAATYTVFVSNPFGTATSNPATLTVDNASGGQLLQNPGFEQGPVVWVPSNNYIIFNDVQGSRSGTWFAYMGDYANPNSTDSLYQTFTIPNGSSSTFLRFWLVNYNSYGAPPSPNVLTLKVRNASGADLATLATFSSAQAGPPAYVQQGPYDLSPYRGQPIQLYLTSSQPSSTGTVFALDDFTLDSSGGGGGGSGTAPSITQQPQSQTVPSGGAFTFQIIAGGSDPKSYRWKRNTVAIPGATSNSYSAIASLADNGAQYSCEVTNPYGTVESSFATLTVTSAGTSAFRGYCRIAGDPAATPVPGLTVTAQNCSLTTIGSGSTSSTGFYQVYAGPTTVGCEATATFAGSNYLSATYRCISLPGTVVDMPTLPMIPSSYAFGTGTVSGKIVNALTGLGVSGVAVKLYPGFSLSCVSGSPQQTTTAGDGSFSLSSVPYGYYTIETALAGFSSTRYLAYCRGGTTNPGQDGVITPTIAAGQIRIVLTWGATPSDLDSHLTGPDGGTGRFHVYYANKVFGTAVNLDLDDTTSYGPETTTILQRTAGTYRFYVHDFSNGGSTTSTALSLSSAKVQVYNNAGLVATFNVPASQVGNLWTVFLLDGTSGTITPVNSLSNVSSTSNLPRQPDDDPEEELIQPSSGIKRATPHHP